MIDFSTGVSPLPTPPSVLAAARAADLARYPHPTALPLREALAAATGRAPDQLVAGAGSVELIWALARAFAGPGRRVLVLGPAFGEYAQAARASGAEVHELRAPSPPFLPSLPEARAALAAGPSLAFVARPGNPGLGVLSLGALDSLARAAPSTLWVVDEAYLPMCEGLEPAPLSENVAVLRSFTKVLALPGLRLGALFATAPIVRAVQACLPPWNVSAPAIAAGRAALEAHEALAAVPSQIAALRTRMVASVGDSLGPLDAAAGPFLLYRCGEARAVTAALLDAGVRVRDCTSFGLPAHVRLGVRLDAEQEQLARALADVRIRPR
jgi:histidinol-phosphate/aromatic aminotransferase/cobyric acid decarboxylase-like protein